MHSSHAAGPFVAFGTDPSIGFSVALRRPEPAQRKRPASTRSTHGSAQPKSGAARERSNWAGSKLRWSLDHKWFMSRRLFNRRLNVRLPVATPRARMPASSCPSVAGSGTLDTVTWKF